MTRSATFFAAERDRSPIGVTQEVFIPCVPPHLGHSVESRGLVVGGHAPFSMRAFTASQSMSRAVLIRFPYHSRWPSTAPTRALGLVLGEADAMHPQVGTNPPPRGFVDLFAGGVVAGLALFGAPGEPVVVGAAQLEDAAVVPAPGRHHLEFPLSGMGSVG